MAAKEKTSRLTAWLAPILLLLAAVAAAQPASALTCGALETRAWEKTSAPLESRPAESLQLLNLHQQNGSAGYDCALGSPLAAESEGIVAQNGTKVTGFTQHGVDRAVGDAAQRAGTTPQAILDALKNPQKIVSGVDSQGRPFQIFTGQDARVVVNPQTGQVVSVNPLSGAGAH